MKEEREDRGKKGSRRRKGKRESDWEIRWHTIERNEKEKRRR